MRTMLVVASAVVALAIGGSTATAGSTKSCPGGPPGHCKGGSSSSSSKSKQQQQQQQTQSQRQCILVLGILSSEPVTC